MVNYSKIYGANCFPVLLSGNLNLSRERIELCEDWKEEIENYVKIMYEKRVEKVNDRKQRRKYTFFLACFRTLDL